MGDRPSPESRDAPAVQLFVPADGAHATALTAAGFDTFDAFWNLQRDWFERPNRARGGWSGVTRLRLTQAAGGQVGYFVKRQENFRRRTWRRPLRGELVAVHELRMLIELQRLGVPSLEPVCFMQHAQGSCDRAVLVTAELYGFESLSVLVSSGRLRGSMLARRVIVEAAARLIRDLHRHCIRHGCLYPEHIFVKGSAASMSTGFEHRPLEVRLIDLEKARWHPFSRSTTVFDLSSLDRHAPHWNLTDRMRFFKAYLGCRHLTSSGKRLWRLIARRSAARRRVVQRSSS